MICNVNIKSIAQSLTIQKAESLFHDKLMAEVILHLCRQNTYLNFSNYYKHKLYINDNNLFDIPLTSKP